jgi:hypothetical protein
MGTTTIYANGVSGLTGEYLIPPIDAVDVAALARRPSADPTATRWAATAGRDRAKDRLGLPYWIEPTDLRQAGWAIVFASGEDAAVKDALAPLIEHRAGQVGDLLHVLEYDPARPWRAWMDDRGIGAGSIDPTKLPYYVLLVGPPTRIPFLFQSLLDIDRAVGRLDLDDPQAYRRYADGMVAVETGGAAPRDRTVTFFATDHDAATRLSSEHLIGPLASGGTDRGDPGIPVREGYRSQLFTGPTAVRETLRDVVRGSSTAGSTALFFSATHGIGGFPPGHPEQVATHGALLCQDWPGLGRIGPDAYFAARDIPDDARVHGMVAFLFACFGAGTPQRDEFWREAPGHDPVIATEPFTASLAKALLSHPAGGASAVIGHVDRATALSFYTAGGPQLVPFQNAIGLTLRGVPVGHALAAMNARYAELSAELSALVARADEGYEVDDQELAREWTERNDAQNHVLLGDPAVRLSVAAPP